MAWGMMIGMDGQFECLPVPNACREGREAVTLSPSEYAGVCSAEQLVYSRIVDRAGIGYGCLDDQSGGLRNSAWIHTNLRE